MVTNDSSLREDLTQLGRQAHQAGQQVGLLAEDPVPGDEDSALALANHLTEIGDGLTQTGQALRRIDTGGWTGRAATAFRAGYLDHAPQQWLHAGDAFTNAGRALHRYATTLAEQKRRGERAQHELDQAQQEAARCEQQLQQQIATYNASAAAYNMGHGPRPGPPPATTNPAEPRVRQAETELAAARTAARQAGDQAAHELRKAAAAAPHPPDLVDRIATGVSDTAGAWASTIQQMAAGAADMVSGVVSSAADLAPNAAEWVAFNSNPTLRWQDPAGARKVDNMVTLSASSSWQQTWQKAKDLANVDEWHYNTGRAAGERIPNTAVRIAAGAGLGELVSVGADARAAHKAHVIERAATIRRADQGLAHQPVQYPWSTSLPPERGRLPESASGDAGVQEHHGRPHFGDDSNAPQATRSHHAPVPGEQAAGHANSDRIDPPAAPHQPTAPPPAAADVPHPGARPEAVPNLGPGPQPGIASREEREHAAEFLAHSRRGGEWLDHHLTQVAPERQPQMRNELSQLRAEQSQLFRRSTGGLS